MPASSELKSTAQILGFVQEIRSRGVKLWPDAGQLKCEVPRGALSALELDSLKTLKGEIVAMLERTPDSESVPQVPVPRQPTTRLPLTLSQLLHWHHIKSGGRLAQRTTAIAVRWRGDLNVAFLKESVIHVVLRHEALRTNITLANGIPGQTITPGAHHGLQVTDLTAAADSELEEAVSRCITDALIRPINLASDPLFEPRLLNLRPNHHVLILATEHMISDAWSLNLILRDIITTYLQRLDGRDYELPKVQIQFPDYAVWQAKAHKQWLRRHGLTWNARMKGCGVTKFPSPVDPEGHSGHGWSSVQVEIDKGLKAALLEWCRERRTTLPLCAFAVYAALVLRWCNCAEAVIQYQAAGRMNPKLENTVGFFASVLYLRMSLSESHTFLDLLTQVVQEYCRANLPADFCHMGTQVPRPELARNTIFNWIPQAQSLDVLSPSQGKAPPMTLSPVPFVNPVLESLELDTEPWIAFVDSAAGVVGTLHFQRHRFPTSDMERFSRHYRKLLLTLLEEPERRLGEIDLS